jgi:hypothetical protein
MAEPERMDTCGLIDANRYDSAEALASPLETLGGSEPHCDADGDLPAEELGRAHEGSGVRVAPSDLV